MTGGVRLQGTSAVESQLCGSIARRTRTPHAQVGARITAPEILRKTR